MEFAMNLIRLGVFRVDLNLIKQKVCEKHLKMVMLVLIKNERGEEEREIVHTFQSVSFSLCFIFCFIN